MQAGAYIDVHCYHVDIVAKWTHISYIFSYYVSFLFSARISTPLKGLPGTLRRDDFCLEYPLHYRLSYFSSIIQMMRYTAKPRKSRSRSLQGLTGEPARQRIRASVAGGASFFFPLHQEVF
jgi:hypothetical protein